MSASQYMPDYLDRATSIARLHDFAHHWSAQVDHAFVASKLITSEKPRLELLFTNYQALINAEKPSKAHCL